MYIDSRSWHARVYRWWKEMKYGTELYRAPQTVNLCPYMRAVLFWSWSRWLFLSGRIGRGRFAVRIPPVFWSLQPLWLLWAVDAIWGHKTLMNVLQVLGFIVAVLSALSVAGLLIYAIARIIKAEPVQDVLDGAADGALSFGRVIKENVVAGHHKICPVIEFRDVVE